LVPRTTSARGSRFEAAVAVPFLKAGAFDAQNLITIPHARLPRVLGKLNSQQLAAVDIDARTTRLLGSRTTPGLGLHGGEMPRRDLA
jgi:hypothetical protein